MDGEVTTAPQEPRIRKNGKQLASGRWQLDITVETFHGEDGTALWGNAMKELEAEVLSQGGTLLEVK